MYTQQIHYINKLFSVNECLLEKSTIKSHSWALIIWKYRGCGAKASCRLELHTRCRWNVSF